MSKVNLVPKEEQAREYRRQFYIVPVAAGLIIVGALAGSYYYYGNQVTNADDKLQQIRASSAGLQKQITELNGYEEVKNKKQTQLSLINGLYNSRVRWSRTLDDLAFVIPDDVWLISIKASVPNAQSGTTQASASAATTARDVEIEGFTREMPSVATFLIRLGLIQSLSDVTLDTASKEDKDGQTVTHFKISASLKQTGDTQQPAVAPTTGEGGPSPVTPTTGTSTSPTGTTPATGTVPRTTGTTTTR